MTQQTGVIKKAWLEAIMNSVDADATTIDFDITEERTIITDDGNSISEQQIDKAFKEFGAPQSESESKEFGRFRMGRGQMFAFGRNIWRIEDNYLIVDIENDTAEVTLQDCTDQSSNAIIANDGDTYELNTEGNDFVILDAEQYGGGTEIEMQHYKQIDDLHNTVREFKEYVKYIPWMHDVEVSINGTEVDASPEVVEETELAWYIEESQGFGTNSSVYNKGAYVDDFNLGPKQLGVLSKGELDVTISRTDVLDTDPYWQNIQDEHKSIVLDELCDTDGLASHQKKWLLSEASEDPSVLQSIKNKRFIEDVNGNNHTLQSLSNESIGFAPSSDDLAKKTMKRTGTIILQDTIKNAFDNLIDSAQTEVHESNINEYADLVKDELKHEMKKIRFDSLSKRRKTSLEYLRKALNDVGFRLDIEAGYSNHKRVWKDENNTVFIHRDELNQKRQKIATSLFFQVVAVASHNGETITSMNEDYSLKNDVYQAMSGTKFDSECDFATAQCRIMNGRY